MHVINYFKLLIVKMLIVAVSGGYETLMKVGIFYVTKISRFFYNLFSIQPTIRT